MTVDVEEHFQVSAFENQVNISEWNEHPSRVTNNTEKLLDLFDQRNIKITFFVLGWVAEQHPDLVKLIAERGHEVACHGYSHQLVYNQTPDVFKEETVKAKAILEQLVQQPVRGYRAASYSITRQSLWAIDILAEAGFEYDSSIFPVHHDRYGIPDAPQQVHIARTEQGNEIVEFPLSTLKTPGPSIPIAGGGYFRIYPYWLTRLLWNAAIKRQQEPLIFYLHPWEIDPGQPRIANASLLSRFRHYNNLGRTKGRLSQLVQDFPFCTMGEIIDQKKADTLPSHLYSDAAS